MTGDGEKLTSGDAVVDADDLPAGSDADDDGEVDGDADDDSAGGSALGPFSDHEATQEEIDQLEKEREERLDPENRPANAEVDNTQREWVSEEEDFRYNLEGNPPEWDKGDGAGTTRDPEIWKRLEEQTGKPIDE